MQEINLHYRIARRRETRQTVVPIWQQRVAVGVQQVLAHAASCGLLEQFVG
jgi:hypothetical protein